MVDWNRILHQSRWLYPVSECCLVNRYWFWSTFRIWQYRGRWRSRRWPIQGKNMFLVDETIVLEFVTINPLNPTYLLLVLYSLVLVIRTSSKSNDSRFVCSLSSERWVNTRPYSFPLSPLSAFVSFPPRHGASCPPPSSSLATSSPVQGRSSANSQWSN